MNRLIALSLAGLLFLTGCNTLQRQPEINPVETVFDRETLRASELRIAESALYSGETQIARSLYSELSLNYPNNPEVWLGLGNAYYLDNELELAQGAYIQAENLAPSDADPKLNLARIAIRMRDFNRAEEKIRAVLATDPTHPVALASLGVIFDLTNQPELAQQTYRKGLEANPGNEALRSNLGLSLALNGKAREAVNVLLGHTGVSNSLPQARENLALAYGLLGRDDAAEEILLGSQPRGQVLDNLEFYRYLRAHLSPYSDNTQ